MFFGQVDISPISTILLIYSCVHENESRARHWTGCCWNYWSSVTCAQQIVVELRNLPVLMLAVLNRVGMQLRSFFKIVWTVDYDKFKVARQLVLLLNGGAFGPLRLRRICLWMEFSQSLQYLTDPLYLVFFFVVFLTSHFFTNCARVILSSLLSLPFIGRSLSDDGMLGA